MASNLLDALGRLSATVLYLAAFGLAFGEAAFLLDLLIPGEVGLVVAGAAGHQRGAALPVLIAMGALGAVAGDSMSWLIGRRWGTAFANRWDWTRRLFAPKLDSAQDLLARRGGAVIFGARWVGALRALVPMVAGAAEVPFRTVLVWDIPAAIGWSTAAVCLGWFLGEPVADVVDSAGKWISIVVVVALVGAYLWRRRRSSGEAPT
jgi:membrane protein DedA with SNARE-associated domain